MFASGRQQATGNVDLHAVTGNGTRPTRPPQCRTVDQIKRRRSLRTDLRHNRKRDHLPRTDRAEAEYDSAANNRKCPLTSASGSNNQRGWKHIRDGYIRRGQISRIGHYQRKSDRLTGQHQIFVNRFSNGWIGYLDTR